MKKLFFLLALMLNSFWANAQYSGSGNGTENDPYLIYNETQLYQMNNFLGSSNEGVVFKLMKDLDLTDFISDNFPSEGWMPVGVESTPFQGKFYGNSHTISGMWINRTSTDNIGLFGYVSGATIKDLKLQGNGIVGKENVGGLCGYAASSTFTNCGSEFTSVSGSTKVGGLIGQITSTSVTQAGHAGEVKGSSSHIGGLIGQALNSSTITTCSITSNVSGTQFVGGVLGQLGSSTLNGSTNTGDVTGTGSVGGAVGVANGTSTLTNVKQFGDAKGSSNVGGVVGEIQTSSSVSFSGCQSKGEISNTGNYTGGIVGLSDGCNIADMQDCSHFGDISGKGYVGGLIGCVGAEDEPRPIYYGSTSSTKNTKDWTSTSTVEVGNTITRQVNNCTAIGNITGQSNVGGLVGHDDASITYTAPSNYKPSESSGTIGNKNSSLYLWRNGNSVSGNRWYFYSPVDKENVVQYSYKNSYYCGIINGTINVGGIAGYKECGNIQYCYTNAYIYGNTSVGGIVGNGNGNNDCVTMTPPLILESNVAINNTISATVENVGRIYGTINDNVTIGALASAEGNRALTTTKVILQGVVQEVADDFQNGNVMGQSLLRLKANYVALGWDFDDNWNILETECFPYKKYQAAPPVIESDLVSQATEISGSSLNGGTVFLYYKDRDAVSTTCNGNAWTFSTDKLQSGAPVQLYAEVDGLTTSYLTSSTVGYPGSGTEADPYRIYTAEDLQGASNRGYYKLMNDIDLTSWINENSPIEGWVSIGRNSGEVTYINGDGHKVTGLWINTTQDYTGLFSNFSAGVIKNLTVEVANGKKVKGGDYTGVLIGRNANGQLLNCTVKGDVEGTAHVGGVTGYSGNNTVNGISYEGQVTSSASNAFVGGFAGLSENDDITSVHSFATISSTGTNSVVGGAIGKLNGGSMTKSHAETTLTATGTTDYVGGLVGYSKGGITLSYTTGEINATGANSYTGGLVGYAYGSIANSYSTAKVSGTQYTAGLCAYSFSTIDKCYAKGDVYGSVYGAGVVGELDGSDASLTNSAAINNILELTAQSAWGSRVIGGFRNGANEPNTSNYALSTMQVSLNGVPQKKTDDAVEGIAKPSSALMSADTYVALGWDYEKTWGIDEGQIYPYLLWEVDVNPVTEITFDNPSLIIAQGKTATLTASVMPLGATNKRLSWTSDNTSVATVADGVVSAVGIGTATITAAATDGSNVSATCKVTVVANKDAAIAELQALVDQAQVLYDNSTEGDNIGEYQSGARSALLAVIRNVKAQISSTMSDETIVACTNDMNGAISAFQEKKVSAGADTDISAYENIIYVKAAETAAGSQAILSLMMNNTIAPTGFQCDIYLPDGMEIATDEDDFFLIDLGTTRTTSKKTDYFNSARQSDGSVRIMCSSTKNYTFTGNDGEVANITINIDKNVENGEYPIVVKNIVLSDVNSKTYELDYVKTTLTISSYTIGDANADGKINVGDFTAIAGYIMGTPPTSFVEKAADVNQDNNINVGDLTGVATLILNGTLNAKVKRDMQSIVPSEVMVDNCDMVPGKEFTVDVNINGEDKFSGYQFDVLLPEGVRIKTVNDSPCVYLSTERTNSKQTDYFRCVAIEENRLRVLGASTTGALFKGTKGSVARLTFIADADVADDKIIAIEDAVISNGGRAVALDPVHFVAHATDATSITNVNDMKNSVGVYDITGKKIQDNSYMKYKKGIYIINGKIFKH